MAAEKADNMASLTSIADRETLLTRLAEIDISVPPRGPARTAAHRERWTICRLLATLADNGELEYPLSLEKRERPDFKLTLGRMTVGVEITEATSQQFEKARTLADGPFFYPSHFRPGGRNFSKDELRGLVGADAPAGPGWGAKGAEKDWVNFISKALQRKLSKLSDEGFDKFDRNWLSIYDNSPKPMRMDYEIALEFLGQNVAAHFGKDVHFDNIIIESREFIFLINSEVSKSFNICDLW